MFEICVSDLQDLLLSLLTYSVLDEEMRHEFL